MTSIFWMLWLVLPVIVGCNAIAEERKAGVMESQLCLPVSRRVQFFIKAFVTLGLGIFLGGMMPMVVEATGAAISDTTPVFLKLQTDGAWLVASLVAFAAWLALVSFFASSLAKSFLQAAGFGVATFFGCVIIIPVFTGGRMLGLDWISTPSFLPLIIAVPTVISLLIWLAYLNFKDFREGWPIWRRTLNGVITALLFIFISSNLLYHRAWEVFEPAEPAHGPAKLSLASPPVLRAGANSEVLACFPGGRVWCDYLMNDERGPNMTALKWLWSTTVDPFEISANAQRIVGGSNYISATVQHVDFETSDLKGTIPPHLRVNGYLETVGIKADGTLWISEPTNSGVWTGDKMSRYGAESDWRQVVGIRDNLLLLKNNGTLWHWGINQVEWPPWQWPSLRNTSPHQIGAGADWTEIYNGNWIHFARKSDGTAWKIAAKDKSGEYDFIRETNLDQVPFQTLSFSGTGSMACVRPDGTLWLSWLLEQQNGANIYSAFTQVGTEAGWKAVALNGNQIVALKSDGSLWQWDSHQLYMLNNTELIRLSQSPPTRLGIHNDWVAIAKLWDDTITLAADGSLWLWPDHNNYERDSLLKLSKQPRLLDNVLGDAN